MAPAAPNYSSAVGVLCRSAAHCSGKCQSGSELLNYGIDSYITVFRLQENPLSNFSNHVRTCSQLRPQIFCITVTDFSPASNVGSRVSPAGYRKEKECILLSIHHIIEFPIEFKFLLFWCSLSLLVFSDTEKFRDKKRTNLDTKFKGKRRKQSEEVYPGKGGRRQSVNWKLKRRDQMASSSSYNSPCAACKFLRRKCMPGCIFAPYFPPEEPQKFANVHKIFGASNVTKLLNELLPDQREDAVNSLAYEAEARVRDPVYGCVGAISYLQRQVQRLQKELDAANADLLRYACNEIQQQAAQQPPPLSSPQLLPPPPPPPGLLAAPTQLNVPHATFGGFYQQPPQLPPPPNSFLISYPLPWNENDRSGVDEGNNM